jgi:hypothetical protein
MMASTVVALFKDFGSANSAVRELIDNGFPRSDISLIASDAAGDYSRELSERTDLGTEASATAEGASVGAGIGAVIGGLGGLLVGLGALAIPGIGPVIAAGPLAAALSALAGAGAGAVAGGVTGGLLGALMDLGIPRETAEYYAEGVRRGGHLVTVSTPDHMTNRAVEIMNHHNPTDINERVEEWRQTGWTGFDPNAGPYTESESHDWPRSTGTSVARDEGLGTGMSTPAAPMAGSISPAPAFNEFSYYDSDFRRHFETSSYASDYTYDQYRPAYRYGYDLATDDNFRGRNWDEIEIDAHRRWDERNPGTWERFKDSVRHAWEEIKDMGR